MTEENRMKPVVCEATIELLEPLGADIVRVSLALDAVPAFQAGQYLELALPDGNWAPFSLACAPGSRNIELHIQYLPGRETAAQLRKLLQPGHRVQLRMPAGGCYLQGEERPLLLVAAGTGFAQMKSILEAAWNRGWQAPITLYWAARTAAGLYALEQAQAWQQQHAGFTLVPVVELAEADWQGRTGRITETLAADFLPADSASQLEGYISGSPAMVYAVEDLLMSRGMPARALHSDVHDYAPREYPTA